MSGPSTSSNGGVERSPSWGNAAKRSDGISPGLNAQLTEGERQALMAVRTKVRYAQRIGNVGGAGLMYYWLHVRNPGKYTMPRKIAFTIVGSLVGGALAMPLGVIWGQSDVSNKVEDQGHFKKVLDEAARQKRKLNPGLESGRAPSQSPATAPAPTLPSAPTRSSQGASEAVGSTNKWGDESFDDSALYTSHSSSTSTGYSGSYDRFGSGSSKDAQTFGGKNGDNDDASANAEPSRANPSSSRWAELRGEKSQDRQGSWDRVRSQSARQPPDPSNDGRKYGYGRTNDSGSRSNSPDVADPTFGKGLSPQRAQAQREYEASFERERRGIDG